MRSFIKTHVLSAHSTYLILLVTVLAAFSGCHLEQPREPVQAETERVSPFSDITIEELLSGIEMTEVDVVQRAPSPYYIATAKGSGTIPGGEFAGDHFTVSIRGEYAAPGFMTLVGGEATVKVQGEKFTSISDPLLQSFCCGEGSLYDLGTHWEFTVFGQVVHSGHNHLFAGFGSTQGTMNMNVADQTGTVVEPAVPPHDPGIGLIEGIPSPSAKVKSP
ncbi:MAG: hypothetical protein R3330_12635 [Saprospiraceae bacterium]|nr:hypothetical protein [Saprospiraceae bacterium]